MAFSPDSLTSKTPCRPRARPSWTIDASHKPLVRSAIPDGQKGDLAWSRAFTACQLPDHCRIPSQPHALSSEVGERDRNDKRCMTQMKRMIRITDAVLDNGIPIRMARQEKLSCPTRRARCGHGAPIRAKWGSYPACSYRRSARR